MFTLLPLAAGLGCAPPTSPAHPWAGEAVVLPMRHTELKVSADVVSFGELELRFSAFGRPNALHPVEALPPEADRIPARVRLRGPAVDALWQALPGGVEQLWEIPHPPPGDGPLMLVTEVAGARPVQTGDAVTLEGARSWQVGGVQARDARGRRLDASLRVEGQRLVVRVDDRGAAWPVLVDPLYIDGPFVFTGSADAYLGSHVAKIGDINGDGYEDLAVGAFAEERIDIYLGSAAGPVRPAATSIEGPTFGSDFGRSFEGDVDVNCDGFDDLIVGAPADNGSVGKAYIYLGSDLGLSTTPAFGFVGPTASSYFGWSITGIGDHDGEGCDDFAVGAYGYVNQLGRAYIFSGSARDPFASYQVREGSANLDLYGYHLDGIGDADGNGLQDLAIAACGGQSGLGTIDIVYGSRGPLIETPPILGHTANVSFGCPMAGAGDVNADGYDDLIVGLPGYATLRGRFEVYMGSASGISTTAGFSLSGTVASAGLGNSVAAAGDVNGDGRADVLVSAPSQDSSVGRSWVYYGDATNIDPYNPTELAGNAPGSYFGAALSSVGDLDANGYQDIGVSAPAEANNAGTLRVYMVYADNDGDGASEVEDCDDFDASLSFPYAAYLDRDMDGFGDPFTSVLTCAEEPGITATSGDCDDLNEAIYPGATELVGDELDSDCDGIELCFQDLDGDGFRTDVVSESPRDRCLADGLASASTPDGDCDDTDPRVYPGAPDPAADSLDRDCSGEDSGGPVYGVSGGRSGCATSPAGGLGLALLLGLTRRRSRG